MTAPRDPASPTNGLPYIIVEREPVNERQMRFHYLLPSGRRRSVVLDLLSLTDETHDRVVAAFEADDYRMAPGRPRRLSERQGG